jgi:hypothetical protein
MKWVAWENIGVDRMGCAWLIRRWIDPRSEFIFVPPGTKPLPKGAEPFDIPGVRYSHHRGHCTFYALLKAYDLKDPVLARIARIVDEADVVQEVSVESAAAGLDLICRGLRRVSRSDDEALRNGQLIYDALYAELSAKVR